MEVGVARCAWLIECGGMHWCSAVGCMLCDVVCAVAYVVGCFLRLSRGGTAKYAVGGWVGASTAAEGAGVSMCAFFSVHLSWLKLRQISFS